MFSYLAYGSSPTPLTKIPPETWCACQHISNFRFCGMVLTPYRDLRVTCTSYLIDLSLYASNITSMRSLRWAVCSDFSKMW